MNVGLCIVEIHLAGSHSLKEKRRVLRRLKDRLRERFNVSVAEIDHQDLWQRTQISAVTVGPDESFLEKVLQEASLEAERVAPECMIQSNVEIV